MSVRLIDSSTSVVYHLQHIAGGGEEDRREDILLPGRGCTWSVRRTCSPSNAASPTGWSTPSGSTSRAVALDMTNFAPYVDTGNDKRRWPSAARPSSIGH